MLHSNRPVVSILAAILLPAIIVGSEHKHPITVEDCVRTRRILSEGLGQPLPIELSPDGLHLAYIVKAPNVETNRNDYQLYVRDLNRVGYRETGRLLLQADRISGIKWIGSHKLVARVARRVVRRIENELEIIDTTTMELRKLEFPVPPDQVSISSDGKVIAFSALATPEAPPIAQAMAQSGDERGYPIMFGNGWNEWNRTSREYEIYLGKITDNEKIEASKLYFRGPENAPRRSSLLSVLDLKLAPDGKYLLIKYSAEALPDSWRDHPLVKELRGLGARGDTYLLGLYEIATEQLRVAFNYPGAFLTASWAQDSRAYSVISPSPLGSPEEKKETKAASSFGRLSYYLIRFNHVFAVDLKSGLVTTVTHRDSGKPGYFQFMSDAPLLWSSRNDMIVRTSEKSISRFQMLDNAWRETARFDLPPDNSFRSLLASNGQVLVGVSQTATTPPDLFMLDLATRRTVLLTDLNPEYRGIALGDVERIEWANRFGSRCVGKLIKPVGYEPHRRYPLVLMANYIDDDYFISDAHYTTAFAPQSLASAGFVVLMTQYPREDKFPRGEFPGEMGQAFNWVSMMETAIDLLAEKGIVDRDQVGIIGFSRTSWLVDFMLTHSSYKITAASSADSGLYTYGGYFRYNRSLQLLRGDDIQVGGPPYGSTRKYWLEYAPPFNAEQITTPLLMEYTGTAEHGFEFFIALGRLGKPVEFFRYPNGEHPLDTPFERLASLQRNVDWFRFWMQSYEGKAPDYDPDQYVRWHKLRDQQQWNDRMRSQGKDPGLEFLRQTAPGASPQPRDRAPAAMVH